MKGLTKSVKIHCKVCNGGTLREDCLGKSCELYEYFKQRLYSAKKEKK
jgi:hypothetical protein